MLKKINNILSSLLMVCVFLSVSPLVAAKKDDGSQIQPDNYYPRVKIETTMGDIVVELDRRRAPITVNNFLRYVDKRAYNDTIFHRIVPGFVVQGGGYTSDFNGKSNFPDIFNESGNGLTLTTCIPLHWHVKTALTPLTVNSFLTSMTMKA